MSPPLALLFCFIFVVFAYRVDAKYTREVSRDLWVPLIWLLITGSRPISVWLGYLGVSIFPPDPSGSPLDAAIYFLLILCGMRILARRQLNWSAFYGKNQILILLFAYMAVSVLWTDDPLVAFKRFIKIIGMLVLATVVLTEQNPTEAIEVITRRCAYVLIPLSEILNKYFDSIARSYDTWSGAAFFRGVADDKNMLGQLCFVVSLVLAWSILTRLRRGEYRSHKLPLALDGVVFGLSTYLLLKSNSATSKVCLVIGVAVLLCGNLRLIRWRIATFLVLGAMTFAILQSTLGIQESMAAALNRDPTLTNRTDIWQELWALRENTLIGTGYEAFWTGERLTKILETRHINESHNGYLEIFLNLGAIGLLLWLMFIVAAYKNCKRRLNYDYDLGRISMALFAAAVIYNLTEAGFRGLSFILFFFLLIGIDTFGVLGTDYIEEEENHPNYAFAGNIESSRSTAEDWRQRLLDDHGCGKDL
jgi:O-antigen ligase